jgi:hypothetical protein
MAEIGFDELTDAMQRYNEATPVDPERPEAAIDDWCKRVGIDPEEYTSWIGVATMAAMSQVDIQMGSLPQAVVYGMLAGFGYGWTTALLYADGVSATVPDSPGGEVGE